MSDLDLEAVLGRRDEARDAITSLTNALHNQSRHPPEHVWDATVESSLLDLGDLVAEVRRLRGHSTTLNSISWRIAEALGDVPPGADRIEGNPIEQADRLIAEVRRLRGDLVVLGADRDILNQKNDAHEGEVGDLRAKLTAAETELDEERRVSAECTAAWNIERDRLEGDLATAADRDRQVAAAALRDAGRPGTCCGARLRHMADRIEAGELEVPS